MALEEDSTAFYRFYISDILPRYSLQVSSELLLDLAKEFELYEETKEFLDEIQPKSLPKKRKAAKTLQKQSPVRRSPRFTNPHVVCKEKKLAVTRSLSGAVIKKQINVKGSKIVMPSTPEPAQASISVQAKKLQEYNQKYFYDKKDAKCDKDDELIEGESKVLVLSTPTKQENQIVYDIKQFKNIFNV